MKRLAASLLFLVLLGALLLRAQQGNQVIGPTVSLSTATGNPVSNGLIVGNLTGGNNDYAVCNISGILTATRSFTVVARVLQSNGTVQVVTNTASAASNVGSPGQLVPIPVVQLPAGQLESMACFDAGSTNILANGSLWVQLYIVTAASPPTVCCGGANTYLSAGYISGFQWVSWSATTPSPPAEIPSTMGWTQVVTVSNPAAGANFVFTPQSSFVRTRIISACYQLTTSSTTANRVPGFAASDSLSQFWWILAPSTIPASTTAQVCGGAGASTSISQNSTLVPFTIDLSFPTWLEFNPSMGSNAPYVLQSSIVGLQAGDQLSNIRIMTQTWQESD